MGGRVGVEACVGIARRLVRVPKIPDRQDSLGMVRRAEIILEVAGSTSSGSTSFFSQRATVSAGAPRARCGGNGAGVRPSRVAAVDRTVVSCSAIDCTFRNARSEIALLARAGILPCESSTSVAAAVVATQRQDLSRSVAAAVSMRRAHCARWQRLVTRSLPRPDRSHFSRRTSVSRRRRDRAFPPRVGRCASHFLPRHLPRPSTFVRSRTNAARGAA
jgi:hypothetical protein